MLGPCVVFSPFRIAITSLGKERAGLCAFRAFVLFCSCWFVSLSSYSLCQRFAAICDCGLFGVFVLPLSLT